jgi:2-polyprenyl-3-methyl-5-hydroxy-6-metoxy-1,4-benzoquinol methylase
MPKSDPFWNQRERYEQTPDRYSELTAIKPVRKLFTSLGNQWRSTRKEITYVDIGCGNGNGTQRFSLFLKETTGMPIKTAGADASKDCQSLCESKGIEFSCIDFNSEMLPYKKCQVVTLFETIEHIFSTDFLLNSIRQSISSDGVLLVTTLNVVCWKNRILVPLGIQPFNTEVSTKKLSYGYRVDSLKRRMEIWEPAGHIRPFTIYSLRDLLEDNGFSVCNVFGLENWRAFRFLEKLSKNMCTGMLVVAKPK